jgi:hypothetical protein
MDELLRQTLISKDQAKNSTLISKEFRQALISGDKATPHQLAAKTALAKFKEWYNTENFVLEKNECSRLHVLFEALLSGNVLAKDTAKSLWVCAAADPDCPILDVKHTFVVRHDWAAAFDKAVGVTDEWMPPFDVCSFEFRISGQTVIALGLGGDCTLKSPTIFVQTNDFWYWCNKEELAAAPGLLKTVLAQIQTICVALDAEAATYSVVRAPVKLNEKRVSKGRRPLPDYYVVDLSKRHRVANPSSGAGGGGKKRLHFRRGHWRHFEETKTWVKWCLVGDPDLGFVNKHYLL